jgi:hypothetical protein
VSDDVRRKQDNARRRRRKFRRQEYAGQVRLTELLTKYLDPSCTAWTSLENRPRSVVAGMLARRAGQKSGVPDTLVVFRGLPVFIEMKSRAGIASKAQQEFRDALVAAGCRWWLVRSARAALAGLRLSGVEFRRPWSAPQLTRWEGPFSDPRQRLPQAPDVASHRREVNRRWRERRRALEATAPERDDDAGPRPASDAATDCGVIQITSLERELC